MHWSYLPSGLERWSPFVYYLPSEVGPYAFTPEECKRIIELADNQELKPGLIVGEVHDKDIRNVEVRNLDVSPDTEWIYQKLTMAVTSINNAWWKLDLSHLATTEVLKYEAGGRYIRHVDHGEGFTTRKVTVSVQLSDPADYDDGDLVLHFKGDPHPVTKELGAIIVFPSFVMHEVNPVTRGVRRAMTAWVEGPPYR